MTELDLTKPLMTRDGKYEVEILCTDMGGHTPVLARYKTNESPERWCTLHYYSNFTFGDSNWDIVNAKPITVFANIYANPDYPYSKEKTAYFHKDRDIAVQSAITGVGNVPINYVDTIEMEVTREQAKKLGLL